MHQLKNISSFCFILFLNAFYFAPFVDAQDCNLTDPLYNYDPGWDVDPCCGRLPEDQVCYNLLPTNLTNYNTLNFFDYPGPGEWSGNFLINNDLNALAAELTSICDCGTSFMWDNIENKICIIEPSSLDFGEIKLTYTFLGTMPPTVCNACPFEPSIIPGCDIQEPNIDILFDPNAVADPNVVIFDGMAGSLTTGDLLAGGEIENPNPGDVDFTGPSINTAGLLLNEMVNSGALSSGAGCSNLNCIDLDALANSVVDDPLLFSSINDNISEDDIDYDTDEYDSPAEMIQAELSDYLDDMNQDYGSFAGFINAQLGFSLPDEECDEVDMISPPSWDEDGNGLKQESQKLMLGGGGSPEQADLNYFDQEIPGLGHSGASGSAPSPSSMAMIEGVEGGVNLYNGTQSTNIPLYTMVANDISLPLSISSSNNGLKVNDLGSLLGENWEMEVGGMVSRMVKGLPDEYAGTAEGVGIGRHYTITPRFEIPSSVDIGIEFPGADLAGICNPENSILNGFCSTVPENPTCAVASFSICWSPMDPFMMDFSINIRLFSVGSVACVFIKLGFRMGISTNEQLGDITYKEEGRGFLFSDDAPLGAPDIPSPLIYAITDDEEKMDYLDFVHPNRRYDDERFFKDRFTTWNQLLEVQNNLGTLYKTDRIDSQPDEFSFTAGSYSGKFSLDHYGNPVLFPNQNLDISYEMDSNDDHIISFEVKTPDGLIYSFGQKEGVFPGYAVDFVQDSSYYLPNFYTYPEDESSPHKPDKFEKAQIDVAKIIYQPWVGPKKTITYGNTYNRNYRIMESPKYSSTWHLVSIKSLITGEEVELNYEQRHDLKYYPSKSYAHTFPNFGVQGDLLRTKVNQDRNDLNDLVNSKWENGRAEFSLSVVETTLDRWDLTSIVSAQRGESIEFFYEQERGEIANDFLCSKILVKRGLAGTQKVYKGWQFDYSEIPIIESVVDCSPGTMVDAEAPPISIPDETVFNLGEIYDLDPFQYHSFFFFKVSIGKCLTFPVRLPFTFDFQKEDYGYRTHMREFGSVMEVKALNGIFDQDLEESIINAEKKRTYLIAVREITREEESIEKFITDIQYHGYEEGMPAEVLPRRYHYDQDLFGYYTDNENGSLLPPIYYDPILGVGNVTVNSGAGVKSHFPFYNVAGTFDATFYKGHDDEVDPILCTYGALKKVELVSGASISYEYEPNEIEAGVAGAGIRVLAMIEDPADAASPPKTTSYSYTGIIKLQDPIRIFQDNRNYYYRKKPGNPVYTSEAIYEEKVVTTSNFQNPIFANKSNFIGYRVVTESWEEIGQVDHHFATIGEIGAAFEIPDFVTPTAWEVTITGNLVDPYIDEPQSYVETPALEFPSLGLWSWFLGLETKTEVKGANSDEVIQLTEYEYEPYFQSGIIQNYFVSEMYQNNYPGTFYQNYNFLKFINTTPFGTLGQELLDGVIDYLVNILDPGANPLSHPYRVIEKNYYVSDRRIATGNIRLLSSVTTNYFESNPDDDETSITTSFTYPNGSIGVPRTKSVLYSDGSGTTSENIFSFDDNGAYPEIDLFDSQALTHLNDIGYLVPVGSKTLHGGNIIDYNLTALGWNSTNSEIVPKSSWDARDGNLSLTGIFSEHNADALPGKYSIALHGATETSPPTMFYDPVELTWNSRMQLESRSYLDFTTTNIYDNNQFYVLLESIDPDGIWTTYEYDNRWRVNHVESLSGTQILDYDYGFLLEAAGENSTKTTLSFFDGLYDPQIVKAYTDGFGKSTKTERIEGSTPVELTQTIYDNFFRPTSTISRTTGLTLFEYRQEPLSRYSKVTDAVGNVTISEEIGDDEFFSHVISTDPNGHLSHVYTDGLGRVGRSISGIGGLLETEGITEYNYDGFGRLDFIINPIGEQYLYDYNEIGRIKSKSIPGAGLQETWLDTKFRPVASRDGNGEVKLFEYDDYNRIIRIYRADNPTLPNSENLVDINSLFGSNDLLLVLNKYESDHTWLYEGKERVLIGDGFGGIKTTTNTAIDGLGRPTSVVESYNGHSTTSNISYVDAGVVPVVTGQSVANGSSAINYIYEFDFDNILRPTDTRLEVNGLQKTISSLSYNSQDLVKANLLGESNADFLQQVDYYYDDAGKLIAINSPSQTECFDLEGICQMDAEIFIPVKIGSSCSVLSGIEINGQLFQVEPPYDVTDNSGTVAQYIEDALASFGKFGEVTQNDVPSVDGLTIYLSIAYTNAESVKLIFNDCLEGINFVVSDCCTQEPYPGLTNLIQMQVVLMMIYFMKLLLMQA